MRIGILRGLKPLRRLCLAGGLSLLLCTSYARGQEGEEKGFLGKTVQGTKSFVMNGIVRVGLNLGATAPMAIPEGVSLISFSPNFNPVISFDRDFRLFDRFYLSTGIRLEYKGMYTRAKVHDFHTRVLQKDEESGAVAEFKGNFTGENLTRVSLSYATIPLSLGWRFSSRYSLALGGYVSYLITGSFSGGVEKGYAWTEPEEGSSISKKMNIDKAEFNFSNELKSWDYGLEIWGRHRVSDHFHIQAGFAMGLTKVFKPDFKGVSMPMRNLYGSVSICYKILGESRRKPVSNSTNS